MGPSRGRQCSLLWAHMWVWVQCCRGTCSHQSLTGLVLPHSANHRLQTGAQLHLQTAFWVGERDGKAILPACFMHDFPSLRLCQLLSVQWTTASPELTSSHTFSLETLSIHSRAFQAAPRNSSCLPIPHLPSLPASRMIQFSHHQTLEH